MRIGSNLYISAHKLATINRTASKHMMIHENDKGKLWPDGTASSVQILNEFDLTAITVSDGNLFHRQITATVKSAARIAFVAFGLNKVKG